MYELSCPLRFLAVSHRDTDYKWDVSHLSAIRSVWIYIQAFMVSYVRLSWLCSILYRRKGNYISLKICKDPWWRISKRKGLSFYAPFETLGEVQRIDRGSNTHTFPYSFIQSMMPNLWREMCFRKQTSWRQHKLKVNTSPAAIPTGIKWIMWLIMCSQVHNLNSNFYSWQKTAGCFEYNFVLLWSHT